MTPQEKAQSLFDKYYIICQDFTEEIQCTIQAKQCALMAVDEVIKSTYWQYLINHINYWEEVKNELNKL